MLHLQIFILQKLQLDYFYNKFMRKISNFVEIFWPYSENCVANNHETFLRSDWSELEIERFLNITQISF